jgi:hypothetical protein
MRDIKIQALQVVLTRATDANHGMFLSLCSRFFGHGTKLRVKAKFSSGNIVQMPLAVRNFFP